ncbi:MAG TPA: NUDIX domain-containing protein [Alphaproteobacteria bacterium]|nr:NUDIX domain-containing protein [Alphaproteobacteria bacterium]HNS44457.1 NUDIX domain-containing protein [Alphaproteobacteria bacterium]
MSAYSLDSIRVVDFDESRMVDFKNHLADCVVVTRDSKILMQQRPANWGRHAGVLNLFGGHVEDGETIVQGLIRELNEELGAIVKPEDLMFIGAVSEDWTDHTELVHVYFWRDVEGTITGCYEAESREYESVDAILTHPKLMDYAAWALLECRKRSLLPL